jgi:hypothetical protein
MPTTTDGKAFNAVWHLRCEPGSGHYVLTVKLYTSLPPARHEALHEALKREAFEWLVANGRKPEHGEVQIEIHRLVPHEEEPGAGPALPAIVHVDPLPEPAVNLQQNATE